ncbi:hypothetical protein OAQ99_00380 [Candidatus Kapabacteria bacterium]|nr:hypothetical protein [Candidatus Kapabacteria bacterium]
MNRALDAYSYRQQTISKNIANATSPHYRPERVKFEELFHKQEVSLQGTRDYNTSMPVGKAYGDAPTGEKTPKEIPEAEIFFSGDTHVNIDHEMSQLAQNQIRHKFGTEMTGRFFGGISKSISGIIR